MSLDVDVVLAGLVVVLAVAVAVELVRSVLQARRRRRTDEAVVEEATEAPPPPGWYPDPRGEGQRYWDGQRWTSHVTDGLDRSR